MNNLIFTWRIHSDPLVLEARFFANEWVCRSDDVYIDLQDICGKSIWLVLAKNQRYYLYGHLVAEKVERISSKAKNVHRGYVLTANSTLSFRVLPKEKTGWSEWMLPKPAEAGLCVAPDSTSKAILFALKENINALPVFSKNSAIQQKIRMPDLTQIDAAYSRALSENIYGDLMWAKNRAITPFAALFDVPGKTTRSLDADKRLREMDAPVLSVLQKGHLCVPSYRRLIAVDTVLRPVGCEAIRAREFVVGEKTRPVSMEKTQIAEEDHQKIVRDLHKFLSERGFIPMCSRSIDLAVLASRTNPTLIFEVKSANRKNFERQARHGLIQILEYKMWMDEQCFGKILPVLVISSASVDEMHGYVRKLAASLGVVMVFHNARHRWEERFLFLEEIVGAQKC